MCTLNPCQNCTPRFRGQSTWKQCAVFFFLPAVAGVNAYRKSAYSRFDMPTRPAAAAFPDVQRERRVFKVKHDTYSKPFSLKYYDRVDINIPYIILLCYGNVECGSVGA